MFREWQIGKLSYEEADEIVTSTGIYIYNMQHFMKFYDDPFDDLIKP